ncbi:MAG TPA: ribosome biogenesis GTPase YlqF [Bacillota bacterium]|nr:ribosome biogenesis GTPase YlqF [Bacillota bacterium]
MVIHWYPGHMAKARRLAKENLKLVDVVIEVIDARIPFSSRNPDINEIAGEKPRLVVLNKADLADPGLTGEWERYFNSRKCLAVPVDSVSGRGINGVPALIGKLAAPKMVSLAASGRRPRAARCMVLGIPNVGKSLFINRLVGKKVARTGNRPGVTRGRQWIRVAENIELMDTPGILWPKFGDSAVAFRLAVTGAIKEEVYDYCEVAGRLVKWLAEKYPQSVRERYKLDELTGEPGELLEAIGRKRGFYVQGGAVSVTTSARTVLKEFREGKLGRFTLEEPGCV